MHAHQIFKFLEYLINSGHSRGHGIHSPFIFDLVSRVLRNKSNTQVVLRIEKIRKNLLSDRRIISMNDLGAGSEEYRSNQRVVSEIARKSAVPEKYGILLSNLASEFGKDSMLELGTSLGISSMYLVAGSKTGRLYTIEGCTECAAIAAENFSEGNFGNIVQHTGSFGSVLPDLLKTGINPGLVFIDGNHRKEPVLEYFSMISSSAPEGAVFVFDDIHWSKEMSEAWEIIKGMDKVTATIDIFRMGIALTQRNITGKHYVLRY